MGQGMGLFIICVGFELFLANYMIGREFESINHNHILKIKGTIEIERVKVTTHQLIFSFIEEETREARLLD